MKNEHPLRRLAVLAACVVVLSGTGFLAYWNGRTDQAVIDTAAQVDELEKRVTELEAAVLAAAEVRDMMASRIHAAEVASGVAAARKEVRK